MKTKSLLLAALMVSFSSVAFSCKSAAATSEFRTMDVNFFGVILKSNAQLILSQSSQPSMRIEGDEKSVSCVKTSFENGTLIIDGKNDVPVTIYLTVGDISLIEVNGPGKIFANQLIKSDILLLKVVGSGSIYADVRSLSLGMVIRGNGKINVQGSTGDSYTSVYGNGKVIAPNLDSYKKSSAFAGESLLTRNTDSNTTKRLVLKLQ